MNQRGKSALTYKQTKIYQQYKITGAAGVITYLKHDIHTYIIYKPQHPTTTKLSPFNSGFSSIIIASAKSYDTKQQIIITSVNRHFLCTTLGYTLFHQEETTNTLGPSIILN